MQKVFDLPKILLVLFTVVWVALAVRPTYPFGWYLENIVVFSALLLVVISYYRFRLSNASYILIFIFALFHLVGAYYTYSNIPIGDLVSQFFGWQRNHYDRFVHFLFGLLMSGVVLDLLQNFLPPSKFLKGLLVFSVIFSAGSLYEIGEFLLGIVLNPEVGMAFLGAQGDIWDTQKDMVMQGIGAILGLVIFMQSPLKRFVRGA
ncbi:MAG TPA: DUF2238 domain-containing protein [Patescibacteria group bacterium]|nr:DUF2238 domain-containing protein [Patescibacteria group bacterium]